MNKLESIKNLLQITYILLSVIRYVNVQLYYSYFNIEIIYYLNLSEILLLFINDATLDVFLISSIFLIYLSLFKFIKPSIYLKREIKNYKILSIPLKFFLKFLYKRFNPIFLALFFSFIIISGNIISHSVITTINKGRNLIDKNHTFKNISFIYNGEKIETDSTLNYIGETKKNLFLYDRLNKKTLIFKNEIINLLKISHISN